MNRKEYQKRYQKQWIRKRRVDWFNANGPCCKCGSNEKLELDHIDPKTKTHHAIWSWSQERRSKELKKCQVLCRACHKEKTKIDLKNIMTGRVVLTTRKYSDSLISEIMNDFYIKKISARQIAKNRKIPRGTVSAWIYDTNKANRIRVGREGMYSAVNRDSQGRYLDPEP